MKRCPEDILFTRYIKLLSGGYCKRCKKYLGIKSRGLHCAHWQSRGKWTTRFERDNCQALCYGCHRYLDKRTLEKDEFFFEILGTKRAQEIAVMSEKTPKDFGLTKESLRAKVKADLKDKIKRLEE